MRDECLNDEELVPVLSKSRNCHLVLLFNGTVSQPDNKIYIFIVKWWKWFCTLGLERVLHKILLLSAKGNHWWSGFCLACLICFVKTSLITKILSGALNNTCLDIPRFTTMCASLNHDLMMNHDPMMYHDLVMNHDGMIYRQLVREWLYYAVQ